MLTEVHLEKVTTKKVHNSGYNLNMQITDTNAKLNEFQRSFIL